MRTAVNSSWARHPGRDNLARMTDIYNAATGQHRRTNASCQHCEVSFLKDIGRLYFAEKEARANAVQEEPKKKPAKKTTKK